MSVRNIAILGCGGFIGSHLLERLLEAREYVIELQELQRRVKAPTVSVRDSLRATIVLRRSEGVKQAQLAEELGVSVPCVNKGRNALSETAWRDCGTGRDEDGPDGYRRARLRRSLPRLHDRRSHALAGVFAPWPGRWGFPPTACSASGGLTISGLTWSGRSSRKSFPVHIPTSDTTITLRQP